MLYSPKWKKTKADPFKLESLIAWAKQQPADMTYNFLSSDCWLCQYFEAHGYQVDHVGFSYVTFMGGETRAIPPHFNDIAFAEPHTFGAALERARAALIGN